MHNKDSVFYQDMLEGMVTSVIWVAQDETIQYMNSAAGELFQISPHRLFCQKWTVLLPGLMADIHQAAEKKITIHEYTIVVAGQEGVRVSCTVSPYDIQGVLGWLIEIYNTERHHRIVEEDERWHQYEAGNLLVKTLAHEVKNPLAGILGATQLLQKRHQPGDRDLVFLEVISKEVLRLTNLVDRMLGPKNMQQKEWHNIHELIRYVLQIVGGEKPSNIFIKQDYDPSIPDVLIDFEAMVQALLNLVKNAIQAMERYGGLLTIKTRIEHKFTLGANTHPLVAVISVMDEGEGIPESVFDSIFYPMVSSKQEGTGLGLSVSQNILRNHDGLIVAESTPGSTVFHVYLPLKKDT
ncbi:MAG: ATP-binding protein [Thiomicrorhabdus sp.]|nr:ATP-binding protein [Thiomicrorhabdus sp.]